MSTVKVRRIDPDQITKVEGALSAGDVGALSALSTPVDAEFDGECLGALMKRARKRFGADEQNHNALDAWIAPRFHNLLRFPRRIAVDPGVWMWLATGRCKPYVEQRWGDSTSWWRYTDRNILRNGVSRLWWAAELVRNGPDYSMVQAALRAVRVFHNLENAYAWHREAARAFVRVVTDHDVLGDDLAPVLNAYLVTRLLEAHDVEREESELSNWDDAWASSSVDLNELLGDVESLRGPEAGYSNAKIEAELYSWLNGVQREIEAGPKREKRRRGKRKKQGGRSRRMRQSDG